VVRHINGDGKVLKVVSGHITWQSTVFTGMCATTNTENYCTLVAVVVTVTITT